VEAPHRFPKWPHNACIENMFCHVLQQARNPQSSHTRDTSSTSCEGSQFHPRLKYAPNSCDFNVSFIGYEALFQLKDAAMILTRATDDNSQLNLVANVGFLEETQEEETSASIHNYRASSHLAKHHLSS
jgi:hypothetical protein